MNGHATGEQTLSQRRAAFALAEVKALVGQPCAKEFRSHASNLPPMIQMNGFGQAMAFCLSKRKIASYQHLYRIVSAWMTNPGQPYGIHDDLMVGIAEEPLSTYRLAQNEALALLDWVKRFASAFLVAAEDSADDASSKPAAEAAT